MDLKKLFEGLKSSKWVWAIYIPLTIPINVLLTFTGTCISLILVALVTLGIPYLFGVRSVKTFLLTGTFIILVTGILFGAILTHFMYNQIYVYEAKTVKDTQLINGSVTPYLGTETTIFNYTVRYIGEEPNVTVQVNYTDYLDWEFKKSKNTTLENANGLFYKEMVLDEDVYVYHFAANINGTWVETDGAFGPINAPYSDTLITQISQWVLILIINAGLFFYMFIIFYWWRKSAQRDRMKILGAPEGEKEKKAEEPEEEISEEEGEAEEVKKEKDEGKVKARGEYSCTACGADVAADDNFCPKCGEAFEGEEEEEGE